MRPRALLGAISLGIALPVAGGFGPCASGAGAQGLGRAGLIVQLSPTDVREFCVSFREEAISGLDLLRRSGLPVELSVSGPGTLVCRIEGKGCTRDDCFCACATAGDPGCVFWGYYRVRGARWRFSDLGAADSRVRDGDVEGWRWGAHRDGRLAPRAASLGTICARGTAIAVVRASRDVPERQRSNALAAATLAAVVGGLALVAALAARARRREPRP